MDEFDKFGKTIDILIGENGCAWDKAQSHESLRINLIEETYEVVDAINKNDYKALCEELGDVLLQVVFHSKLAEKSDEFTLNDVVRGINDKIVSRHRHIFGDVVAETPEEVQKVWDESKKLEKGTESLHEELVSIPNCLPALIRAQKVTKKAARNIEQQSDISDCLIEYKRLSALLETTICCENGNKMEIIGEILLVLTQISNKMQINAEFALTNAVEKFINMFEDI